MGLSIKEPCHEDWAKMTSTEKGAFCQSCAMEVIDFTDKSPIEIKNILAHEFSSNNRTCGRINNYQLDQLNDDFFQWKSDREAFRAVWIFSLVAVFGLTLFSCQNTLSREMIEQLNTETNAMLNGSDSSLIELSEIDSSLAESKKDSLSDISVILPNVPWQPYEIITYQGIMPMGEIFGHQLWIECMPTMGAIAVSGMMSVDVEVKMFLVESSATPPSNSLTYNPPAYSGPSANPDKNHSERVMTAGGDKKFDAFIHPNPIDVSSRLYLSVHEKTDLKITIHLKGETSPLRAGDASFVTGRHEVDLKLYNLSNGSFQLRLVGEKQISILDFEV